MPANTQLTPMMRQHEQIKRRYPDALLLFRVGDFYETFGQDAVKASKILNIVLTKRSNGGATDVELAGFPHHVIDNYLPKLVKAGYRVAVCDQLEDPKDAKGIVKRGVTELATPGLFLHDRVVDQQKGHYLASIYIEREHVGVALLDISTGEFLVAEGTLQYTQKLLQSFAPEEIIFSKTQRNALQSLISTTPTHTLDEWVYRYDYAKELLQQQFSSTSLKGFGLAELPRSVVAAGGVLRYLTDTEHKSIGHITSISRIDHDQYVWMDPFTIRSLELLNPQTPDGKKLIDILDQTKTPMGARLLRKWIIFPLKDLSSIVQRQEPVAGFVEQQDARKSLIIYMSQLSDLERLIAKVATKRINPRELKALSHSLSQIQPIGHILESDTRWGMLISQLDPCTTLHTHITAMLVDKPPLTSHQGGVIRDGVIQTLDEFKKLLHQGKNYLEGLQERERIATGITSLKVGYNKIFGYYLEVTNAHRDKVPDNWIRKQTLVNAERYITEELKSYEIKILQAESQILEIESQVFQDLIEETMKYVTVIQQNAHVLAQLDCLLSFACNAVDYEYVQPTLNLSTSINIQSGRHPVIEQHLPPGTAYVPNDVYLDNETQQILIITGPNMSGKSALLRQVALIVIMAQIGSFVPAKKAVIGCVDKIFTRVGASDNLAQGESTFMIEMTETASILHNLSNNSLILMDEIGRGTSTYDGISIASSIVQFLHDHTKYRAKTLFATHYHELNLLEEKLERVHNFHIDVEEKNDRVIFLHKLEPGGSAHSFGIHVAQMAGMPSEIICHAEARLQELENNAKEQVTLKPISKPIQKPDPGVSKIYTKLKNIDINQITPMEALAKLHQLIQFTQDNG